MSKGSEPVEGIFPLHWTFEDDGISGPRFGERREETGDCSRRANEGMAQDHSSVGCGSARCEVERNVDLFIFILLS